ncbi:MAG: hypothetical protein QFX32_03440 [Methanolinea sp.]|nr:hypothetical protein [Methanolinea sp.]
MRSMVRAIVLVLLASGLAGCTGMHPQFPPGQGGFGSGEDSLKPGPTVTLPPSLDVTVQVNEKDPIYATVPVIFAGGKGQVAVRDILVRLTTSEGQVIEGHLEPVKGAEVKLQGTRGDDRLEVLVTLTNGNTYKIIDRTVKYRTRG